MWEAAARAGPTVRHRATAASATRSTRWATAAGLLEEAAAAASGPAASGGCAATRRPPPNCWARAPALPCRWGPASSGRVRRRGTSLLEQAPLPGPVKGPHARLAPAPTLIQRTRRRRAVAPTQILMSGGCGRALGPRFALKNRHVLRNSLKSFTDTSGRALPAESLPETPPRPLFFSLLVSYKGASSKKLIASRRRASLLGVASL